jgi:hypothetical protein
MLQLSPYIDIGARVTARKSRRIWQPHEVSFLQAVYAHCPYPPTAERNRLARMMHVTPRRVQIWFQNARARAQRVAAGASNISWQQCQPA